jgi:hypothetical protein
MPTKCSFDRTMADRAAPHTDFSYEHCFCWMSTVQYWCVFSGEQCSLEFHSPAKSTNYRGVDYSTCALSWRTRHQSIVHSLISTCNSNSICFWLCFTTVYCSSRLESRSILKNRTKNSISNCLINDALYVPYHKTYTSFKIKWIFLSRSHETKKKTSNFQF